MILIRFEKVELALIALAPIAVFAGNARWAPSLGTLVASSAALLLMQGLLRDLARIARFGRKSPLAPRRIACLCAETSVGLPLVALGIALAASGASGEVALGRAGLAALVACVLGAGFVLKDYVVVLKKEKDHASVIVW